MRIWSPDQVFFVTNRCEQERLFLLPKPHIIKIIGAWLAKALLEHGNGIELFGFIFLSNHLHMLLRDTKGKLPELMWFFQLNLAKAVNRELGRKGHFFAREYDAAPVLDDEAFENRYAYIMTNAVKAGLVARAADAPFFSSLTAAMEDKPLVFEWKDRTRKHNKSRRGQKVDDAELTRTYTFRLAVPPCWRGWSKARRRSRIAGLVKANEARYARARRAEGRDVLGARRIMSQSPLMRPRNPSRSPRVRVFCSSKEMAEEFLESVKAVVGLYRDVLDKYLKASARGRRAVLEWPPGTYPPSSMVCVAA